MVSARSSTQRKSAGGIYRNAAFVAVADIASKGATALLALMVARFFGPTLYGHYATAAAVCGLLLIVTDVGFERELIRRGGKDPTSLPQSLAFDFASIALSAVIATATLAVVVSLDLYSAPLDRLIWLMGLALLLGRPRLAFRQVCMIWQRSAVHAAVQLTSTVVLLGLTLAALMLGTSLETIVAVQAWVALLGLWFWFRWLPAGFFRGVIVTLKATWTFIKDALPFGYAHVIWVVYFNFDTFLLSLLRPAAEVGIYAGVYRLIGINYVLGYALASTFTPLLFRKQHTAEYAGVARQLVLSTAGLGVFLAGALFILSPLLVTWIIGPQFSQGIGIARVLSMAVLFRVVNYGLGEILTTQDRQSLRNKMETLLLVTNMGLNFLFIPHLGGLGAAVATVGAEAVLFASFVGALLTNRNKRQAAAT